MKHDSNLDMDAKDVRREVTWQSSDGEEMKSNRGERILQKLRKLFKGT